MIEFRWVKTKVEDPNGVVRFFNYGTSSDDPDAVNFDRCEQDRVVLQSRTSHFTNNRFGGKGEMIYSEWQTVPFVPQAVLFVPDANEQRETGND